MEVDSNQLQQYKEQIDSLQEENKRLQEENVRLKNQVHEMEETIQTASQREVQSTEMIKRLGEENTKLREEKAQTDSNHLLETKTLLQEVEKEKQEKQELIESNSIQKNILEQKIVSLQGELEKTKTDLEKANQQHQPEAPLPEQDSKSVGSEQRYINRLEWIEHCYNELDKMIADELLQICPIEEEKLVNMPGFERFRLLINTIKNGVQYDQQLVQMVLKYLVQLIGNEKEAEYNDFVRIEEMFKILCNRSRNMYDQYEKMKKSQLTEIQYYDLVALVRSNLERLIDNHTYQGMDDYGFVEDAFQHIQKRERNLLNMNEEFRKEIAEARKVKSEIVRFANTVKLLDIDSTKISWSVLNFYIIQWEQLFNNGRAKVDKVVTNLAKKLDAETKERQHCQETIRKHQLKQLWY